MASPSAPMGIYTFPVPTPSRLCLFCVRNKRLPAQESRSTALLTLACSKDLYFSVISGQELWSVPTAALRARDAHSELVVQASVSAKGQKGVGDGMETDSNGIIYTGHVEQEAIVSYAPGNATVQTFLRDPRISWVDTLSVGWDGSLYFTVNQVHLMPGFFPGAERRQHPYVLFKTQLPDGGKKVGT
ncbi:btb/poz-like protein [Metarhizium robertsii ARSEF 23]|uniref:Btb/poz-like protein n=1 Tax=Metarhizium robertsii (strain ARSEF 23 / ATCC MYA-3075) TaxID=655844 RepID=A0A0B2XFX3_METRA|nr:btb/poz-like protein [Metarhizium robertsii ARSEF 23]KHO10919.1 btb/poz-like protein [Metarhizium robertsii ARSEF 23]